jgi:NAD(P)H-nitrite reductase large subunit
VRYLIIGNSAAAVGAVERIRKIDQDSPITVIADEPYPTYSRPLISYYLEGKVAGDRLGFRGSDFYTANRVETRLGLRVDKVEPEQRLVVLAGGESVGYDRLLVATGSRPLVPPVKGLGRAGVFFFNRFDDALAIEKYVRPGMPVAVIGAGLTGLKAAEALVARGAEVTVADIAPQLLPTVLDAEGAVIVQQHLEGSGFTFRLGVPVAQVTGGEAVQGLQFADGSTLQVQAVIVAAGVQPNKKIVEGTAIECRRGIMVDEKLQTTVPQVYAAGDVAQGWTPLWNEQCVVATLPDAYKQGEAAGRNMAGADQAYAGSTPMNSVSFFDLTIASAGLSNTEAEGLEVLKSRDGENYRHLTLRGEQLVGFICTGEVGRVGILTALIRGNVPLGSARERLLASDFGLVDLPDEVRNSWDWERGECSCR